VIDLRRGSAVQAGAYVYDGAGVATRWHAHAFHQLEYSTRGSLGVASRDAHYTCPPHQAIWIAAGTEHRSLLGHARTISVFLAPELIPSLAADGVSVLEATPLLREMMLYAARSIAQTTTRSPKATSRPWPHSCPNGCKPPRRGHCQ